MDEHYKASLVNIYNDRAVANAAGWAAECELISVHCGLVVHDALQEKTET